MSRLPWRGRRQHGDADDQGNTNNHRADDDRGCHIPPSNFRLEVNWLNPVDQVIRGHQKNDTNQGPEDDGANIGQDGHEIHASGLLPRRPIGHILFELVEFGINRMRGVTKGRRSRRSFEFTHTALQRRQIIIRP